MAIRVEPDNRMIGELLRNPNAARARYVERGFAESGHAAIRQAHQPIFEYIDREHGSRVTTLAKNANISAQSMGELVDHLVRHGYVERIPDPGDGRARLVRLTARGLEVYAIAGRYVRALEQEWAGLIGEARFQELKVLLGELWDAYRPIAEGQTADRRE